MITRVRGNRGFESSGTVTYRERVGRAGLGLGSVGPRARLSVLLTQEERQNHAAEELSPWKNY